MAIFTGLFRLGRDAELRYTPGGEPLLSCTLAYNYGKADGGKRPTQWLDAAMFGPRAEKLQPYLTKGIAIVGTLDDIHIQTFQKRDGGGEGHKLSGRLIQVEFAERREASSDSPASDASAPEAHRQKAQEQGGYRSSEPRRAPASKPAPKTGTGFDDMDDDIPF